MADGLAVGGEDWSKEMCAVRRKPDSFLNMWKSSFHHRIINGTESQGEAPLCLGRKRGGNCSLPPILTL